MTAYKNILLGSENGVARLVLNNPESRNAMTEETKEELVAALDEIERDETVRSVVLTGAGTAFCAGGDVKKIGQELTPDEITGVMKNSQRLLWKLLALEKPVVAAVNGDAFGMGCNLVFTADFPIASEKARFSEAFVKLGVMADFGALYFLPRLVGLWKTKELVYTGSIVSADEAKEMGLIYKVVPDDALQKEASALADRLARMPTKAIGRAKKLLSRTFEMGLSEVLDEEIEAQIALSKTEDHREAVKAFMEKRQAKFQGK
jgi:2-(1,2-epoxy-1,2-dihydrophenyl)acetyl-CoA isomerase